MPVPKKKTSASRQGSRRAHWKASKANLNTCPQCHEPKLAHRACGKCGYYKGRPAVNLKSKEETTEE